MSPRYEKIIPITNQYFTLAENNNLLIKNNKLESLTKRLNLTKIHPGASPGKVNA